MSSPVPMFGTQNLSDDDGPVLDSFLIETDTPPKPILQAIPQLQVVTPKYPTIMKNGYFILTAGITEPFPLIPPDVNRVQMRIRVTSLNASPNASQFVLFASEKSLLTGDAAAVTPSGMSFRMRAGVHPGNAAPDLDFHTGPVWVAVNTTLIQTEGIEVTWMTVSEVK